MWIIQWLCSFFLFSTGCSLFGGIFLQKTKIFCWSWNLEPRLWILILNDFHIFYFFNSKYPFWVNHVHKFKIVSSEIWYLDYFEYAKFDVWLIPREFTRRDMKPVAFLIVKLNSILIWRFRDFYWWSSLLNKQIDIKCPKLIKDNGLLSKLRQFAQLQTFFPN